MRQYEGIKELSVFIECSTNSTPTVNTLKKYIDLISKFGYSHLYLGLTDAYKIEDEPYFNFCRGGYTVEQLQEVDAYAEEHGIELRVNIQVLGHLHYLNRHRCYADLFDTKDSLMVGKPEVYELVDKMLATMSKAVKSRIIHIGMDEIFELGLGRYLRENGYVNNRVLFLEHLNRVVELAKKYNYTCEIWSDMFFRMVQGSDFGETGVIPADIRDSLPKDVRIVHWYYVKQPEENFTSYICQDMILYADTKRIDFKTYVNWQETQKLLKVAFPVDIRANYATYDIQYGNIKRPTHSNTSWEQAKFEVVAHRYVDLSENDYGVSLINDSKYGYDIHQNVMRLTLLKAAIYPDYMADKGEHEFTYSLYPHEGDFITGHTVQEAQQLNQPLEAIEGKISIPVSQKGSSIRLCGANVELDALKKSEDGQYLVLRFHEYAGSKGKVRMEFGFPVKGICEADLMERPLEKFWKYSEYEVKIRPYEIKTYLLKI